MRHPVLDHGYVELVESMGDDKFIVESARMSTDKGFLGWGSPEEPGDEKLLRHMYMAEPQHSSPFEFGELVFEVQAPIFVFREWHRHRTQSYSEMSARYTKLPDVFYLPSETRVRQGKQSSTNKQGSEDGISYEVAHHTRAQLDMVYRLSRETYENLLSRGVSREIARLCIPVAQYSRMRAKANLLNWFKFLTLRMHKNAQWEIRQYAILVGHEVASRFPRTWSLFVERILSRDGYQD